MRNFFFQRFDGAAFNSAVERYVAVGIWMWIPVAIYNLTPIYRHLRDYDHGSFLSNSFVLYLLIGLPIFYFYYARFTGPRLVSKAVAALRFLPEIPRRIFEMVRDPHAMFFPDEKTRVAFLAILIKIFFTPLMVYGAIANGVLLVYAWPDIASGEIWAPWRLYAVFVNILILVDASIFAFGYLVESAYFRNEIKSVDPTFFGWAVALMTYQPFSLYLNGFERAVIPSIPMRLPEAGPVMLIFFLGLSIVCYMIYVWASVALGPRAGNLVNRGIVWHGPYAFVRHPAYAAKNLAWLFALIPVINNGRQLVFFFVVASIYVLRALTEERHLGCDPEYVGYCKKVKYRFFPFLV